MRIASPSPLSQVDISSSSKGPIIEQYLAEEALGLAKSLGWTILQGPFWKQPTTDPSYINSDKSKQKSHLFVEGNVDEIQDGDYIKTSLGSGVLHVDVASRRKTGSSSTKWSHSLTATFTASGKIKF